MIKQLFIRFIICHLIFNANIYCMFKIADHKSHFSSKITSYEKADENSALLRDTLHNFFTRKGELQDCVQTNQVISLLEKINYQQERFILDNIIHSVRTPIDQEKSYDCIEYALRKLLKLNSSPKIILEASRFSIFPIPKYFEPTEAPQKNDLVLYLESPYSENVKHIGIFCDDNTIQSKWGGFDIIEHPLFAIPRPYGNYARYVTLKNDFHDLSPEKLRSIVEKDLIIIACELRKNLCNNLLFLYHMIATQEARVVQDIIVTPIPTSQLTAKKVTFE